MTDLSQHNGQRTSEPEQLERDIARQREQLARTVDELGRKLDVKHRAEVKAHDTAAHVRDAVTTDNGKPRPDLLAAGAAVVAGIALVLWWRSHS
jgi:predicted nucleic acid-binding protein